MIAIVDTGGANIASVVNAFYRLGLTSKLTDDAALIQDAPHVILPGVGAAEDSMNRLQTKGLVEVIRSLTQPVLGICLGMQLLFEKSEEGNVDCLEIFPGTVSAMLPNPEKEITIPHMGWNRLQVENSQNPLVQNLPDPAYVYFVHSYCGPMGDWVAATTNHGVDVPAIVSKNNFVGTQFHPERSGTVGAQILRNFISL